MEKFTLIDDVKEVITNVNRLNSWLKEHPGELDESVRSVKRWYAYWNGATWLFGFSKFIGYKDLVVEDYKKNHNFLNGGTTETVSPLHKMSIEISIQSPLYRVLKEKLLSFLNEQGRDQPRTDATIRVLLANIEGEQSFTVLEECRKAASQNGFRREYKAIGPWATFGSTTALGSLYLAAYSAAGPWLMALDHSGVVSELNIENVELSGPGIKRFAFDRLDFLYKALSRVYKLSVSLPDAPLKIFQNEIKELPSGTEAERLVVQRIGQNIFRQGLLDYWHSTCPLTGISDRSLLRASHIIPWKDCQSDADRLDVHNGLLLSALWDAAFDKGLVTFDDNGFPVYSNKLSEIARAELRFNGPIPLTNSHLKRLVWHRDNIFYLVNELD